MITFIIPVRHQATVSDWPAVKDRLRETAISIAGQTDSRWSAVVVANRGAELPNLPAKFNVVRVDFAPPVLPDPKVDEQEFYEAIRLDKGRRILAGFGKRVPKGHVMVVDYDDFISNRLAALCAKHPQEAGWNFYEGYVFSGGDLVFHHDWHFYKLCGTSHIIRADLLKLANFPPNTDIDKICRWLGSHMFITDDFQQLGHPLTRLPFVGSIYRIGHAGSTSGSSGLMKFIEDRNSREPELAAERARKTLPLTDAMRAEFFGHQRRRRAVAH